jgi:hypothetical protein
MSKKDSNQTKFENAEALGDLKTLPFEEEDLADVVGDDVAEIISKPIEFQMAIGHAQMEGKDFVEVTPELFQYLVKKAKTKYLTYGDPGVKVYKAGTREEIEREENMNAEHYHEHIMKKRMAEHAK